MFLICIFNLFWLTFSQINICCIEDPGFNSFKNDTRAIEVGLRDMQGPIVVDESDLQGLDHDLRVKMVEDLGINYTLYMFPTYGDALMATRSCPEEPNFLCKPLKHQVRCDIVTAPYSRTYQRDLCTDCMNVVENQNHFSIDSACCIDYTDSYILSEVGLLYKFDYYHSEARFFMANDRFLNALAIIVIWLVLFAVLIFMCERQLFRRKNPDICFEASSACYMATTTFTTVGYGDYTPKTRIGRLQVMINMLFSMVVVSYTIAILVALLEEEISRPYGLDGPEQLVGSTVCLPGYYEYLYRPKFELVASTIVYGPSFAHCLQKLVSPKNTFDSVDAIFYDITIMQNIPRDEFIRVTDQDYYISLAYKTVSELSWVLGDRRYGIHPDVNRIVNWFNDYISTDDWTDTISEIGALSLQEQWSTPKAPDEYINNPFIKVTGVILLVLTFVLFIGGSLRKFDTEKIAFLSPRLVTHRSDIDFGHADVDVELELQGTDYREGGNVFSRD